MEAAAEANDDLMMKYLEEGDLSDEEIVSGLQEATRAGRVFPVMVGAAYEELWHRAAAGLAGGQCAVAGSDAAACTR